MTVSPFFAVKARRRPTPTKRKQVHGSGPHPIMPVAWLLDASKADVKNAQVDYKYRFVLQFTGEPGKLLWENKRRRGGGRGLKVRLYLDYPKGKNWVLKLGDSPDFQFQRHAAKFDPRSANLLRGNGAGGTTIALKVCPV